ncbi:SsrA-binding protein SmpB [Candidatus Wolfebacteria bacterium]|nr:SsrA-binding protein SmpB [Candidatus Wolfebacteria bacterium]
MGIIIENKKAKYDYDVLEKIEAGIELRGFEVKAIKNGKMGLVGSYVIIQNNQAWLLNADISPYQPKNTPTDYDSKRTRKLLLKKSEIKNLIGRIQEKGLTLVPFKVYTKGKTGKIKLEIALSRSRKKVDKRELIKKRDIEREIGRSIK